MTDLHCLRRTRIHMNGLSDFKNRELYQSLLQMIDGVVSVTANPTSGRLLIVYDDRKIASWQLVALAGRLEHSPMSFLPATEYTLRRHQMYLTVPLILLAGIGVKRLIAGKPAFADSLFAYQLATIVAVFTGYPVLRERVNRLAEKIGISDHILLSFAALFVAVIRESLLVFSALFLLSYNAYRKRNNTLTAAAKAGEVVALIDSENHEPKNVKRFADVGSKIGLVVALGTFIITGNPLLFSTLLVAANPRPAVIGARYGLNHAEIMTHEDCRYIPMHTGMDLYDLLDAKEITILHAKTNEHIPTIYPPLEQFAKRQGIAVIRTTHIHEFKEPVPTQRKRRAEHQLTHIILLSEEVAYPAVHQRQDHLIYLRQNQEALFETLQLSERLHRNIQKSMIRTGAFNVFLTVLAFAMVAPGRINLLADSFAIATLGLSEGKDLIGSHSLQEQLTAM
ncbi:hypothetical protein [Sulfoacidibacillus ferrooxidans]|uniref:Uncharacterized protein n=1 Tax=Sulfoacidibacillus ferrooxidans TaxID=2005001 RepID=A0A9X1V5P0_9BACL|nr:hypothetical protein [Sulfoacidibacillus ferrooxidans]MCI0181784.1 hypothetical protein [Sulfoacidibacillus ferrooxidans]